jgi:hypothetical protein
MTAAFPTARRLGSISSSHAISRSSLRRAWFATVGRVRSTAKRYAATVERSAGKGFAQGRVEYAIVCEMTSLAGGLQATQVQGTNRLRPISLSQHWFIHSSRSRTARRRVPQDAGITRQELAAILDGRSTSRGRILRKLATSARSLAFS